MHPTDYVMHTAREFHGRFAAGEGLGCGLYNKGEKLQEATANLKKDPVMSKEGDSGEVRVSEAARALEAVQE